ncbi:Nudix family hydrolase [Deefgea piscis]|uniref:Nudix family hydrolase n=1 Tax=Deefgea piscis TaxID=2739061 RepID=UPI001C81284E|nr:Nudix family hydrolase [Deefgea piscis]QZA79712.1 Nudix family hydrolase [Deefgea piscis]
MQPDHHNPNNPKKTTVVAAGVLINAQGQFLMGSRPAGKPYAHYWEFPGGKLEAGETAHDALCRELKEEMGIDVTAATPWLTQRFNYPHANVELRFFKVRSWNGTLHGHEGQELAWQGVGQLNVSPILPANGPILRGLALPEVIEISNMAELGREAFMAQLSAKWAAGPICLLLREPQLSISDYQDLAKTVQSIARPHGGKLILHRDLALAQAIKADGIHFTASQLQQLNARPRGIDWVSASTHQLSDLEAAARIGVDFAFLGHVAPTQSHPGQTPLGWEKFSQLLQLGWCFPVFAIGGQTLSSLHTAQAHGGHGVALLRAAWSQTV